MPTMEMHYSSFTSDHTDIPHNSLLHIFFGVREKNSCFPSPPVLIPYNLEFLPYTSFSPFPSLSIKQPTVLLILWVKSNFGIAETEGRRDKFSNKKNTTLKGGFG